MPDVKWIKLTTNMFDDEKIRLIEGMPDADTILTIWVKLLCQAGKTNASGYIYLAENFPYTDEMLATLFNRPLNTVRMALETFQRFGMIELGENGIRICNWGKHQNIDALEKIKEGNRQRVAKHREKQKLLSTKDLKEEDQEGEEEGNITGNVTVTLQEKNKYAEFVSLSEGEYSKLLDRYGEPATKKMIDKLDNYKGSKGKRYKSDYRAILSWVAGEILKNEPQKQSRGSDYVRAERERIKREAGL